MMMITATIFANGPCTEPRVCCNGCSQGMPVPAASAAQINMRLQNRASAPVRTRRRGARMRQSFQARQRGDEGMSVERREGKECDNTRRFRSLAYSYKNHKIKNI